MPGSAHTTGPEATGVDNLGGQHNLQHPGDPSAEKAHLDAEAREIVTGGPSVRISQNADLVLRGVRNVLDATTDVWVHDGFSYTGTFNVPCGGDPRAGIWVWSNKNNAELVSIIQSPPGSRTNDVKVGAMNSGNVLVHSNESCRDGPGGFEVYNVDDPTNPVHLASVGPLNELNPVTNALSGGAIVDVGVHNLWLFTDGDRDYVAAVVESLFDTLRIFDITDPTNPTLVTAWGAEEVFDPGVGAESSDVERVFSAASWLLSGFGASQNRLLHDVTISADGNRAYLSNWDAGLILLDVSDPADPRYISTAIDLEADGDGEVNSHAAWPSEDGAVVVETNEDFAPFSMIFAIETGPNEGEYPWVEAAFTTPIRSLPNGEVSGPTTYVGLGCPDSDPVPAASGPDQIALVLRGTCRFDEKATSVIDAGYRAMVVFNDEANGETLLTMSGAPRDIPGLFVGHQTALAIMGVASASSLAVGDEGSEVRAAFVADGWGQVRIWDYSDPANPVLASSVDTVCSATVTDASCDPEGTYSVHNVMVQTRGDTVKAYISWYWDGMLVLDVTDPYNPVETARYLDNSTNEGLANDFWGVYKTPNDPFIYLSDRNGGLYVLEEEGLGFSGGVVPTSGWRGTFADDDNNIFESDIEWMAEQGITLGCNSAGNLYCPADVLTRAQLASFLVRALDLPAVSGNRFSDVTGTVVADVNALAAAGITLGCNAEGTRFCPGDEVSRAEAASFLARALGLAPPTGNRFADVAGIHSSDINAIAEAGITFGCNPEGDLFCPEDDVSRDQIAAFLHRALG